MAFPKGFFFGAATAAHQVEGNNVNSDYWIQEHLPHTSFTEPSGDACDHYNRYEEDIRLMAGAGLNAYRFSVEWARIEPEEGRFDESEIEHYRKVIACCRENGLEPLVTLHHFTSPAWLIRKGGWEAESTIDYFRRYAAYVAEKLGNEIRYICTINEANMGLQLAAISKRYEMAMRQAAAKAQAAGAGKAQGAGADKAQDAGAGKAQDAGAGKAQDAGAGKAQDAEAGKAQGAGAGKAQDAGAGKAQDAEADKTQDAGAGKAQGAKSAEGKVQVGMNFQKMMENMKYAAMENAQAFGTPKPQVFVTSKTPEGDVLIFRAHQAAKEAIKAIHPEIKVGITLSLHDMQALPGGEKFVEEEWATEFTHYLPYIKDDDFLGVQNYTRSIYGPAGQLPAPEGAELTQMDYEFYPQALEHVIRKVAEDFKGDLIVTENGVAVSDDSRRVAFIKTALEGVERCVEDGLPVKGYCYWSLMDNFEWQKGFGMTFGLIAVDRSTQTRMPKESLEFLGSYGK